MSTFFISCSSLMEQVEEVGGHDPPHPRAAQNTCVFHILLFIWCRWKRMVAVTLSILVLVFSSCSSLGAGGRERWPWPSPSSCWSKYMCFSSPALHLVQVEESGGRDPLHPRASHHGGRGGRPHPQEERCHSVITKLSLKVVGNEKQWGSRMMQMLGNEYRGLFTIWSRSFWVKILFPFPLCPT